MFCDILQEFCAGFLRLMEIYPNHASANHRQRFLIIAANDGGNMPVVICH
ncbi:MAG: hypothetical protein ACR2PV_01075 [Gammaproteobacteria bacterium]